MPQRRQWLPEVGYELVIAGLCAVVLAGLAYLLYMGNFRDIYVVLQPDGDPPPSEVVLLEVDQATFKLWDPLDPEPAVTSRLLLAGLVDALGEAGASVVALDFLLDTPQDGDDALAAALARHPRAVVAERTASGLTRPLIHATHAGLGEDFVPGLANLREEEAFLFSDLPRVDRAPLTGWGIRPRSLVTLPEALRARDGDETADPAAFVTKTPDVLAAATTLEYLPSFALAAAWLHRTPDTEAAGWSQVFCAPSSAPDCPTSLADLNLGDGRAELGADFSIHWTVTHAGTSPGFERISASLLLADRLMPGAADATAWKQAVKGKVVVLGRSDPASKDFFVTAHDFPLYRHADLSGMTIQAQLIDNLLGGARVRSLADGWVALIALLLAGAMIGSARRMESSLHTALCLVLLLSFVGLGALVYGLAGGLIIEPRLPLLAGSLALIGVNWLRWLGRD